MNTVICFDNGICGILRRKLPSSYKIFEYQENLALGDIRCCDDAAHRETARKILFFNVSTPDIMEQYFQQCNSFLLQFQENCKSTSEITIWLERSINGQISAPNICNALFILSHFQTSNIPIYYVLLDRHRLIDLPQNAEFLQLHRTQIPENARIEALQEWSRLVIANKPLRIYKEGRLLSADVSYYDEILLAAIKNVGPDLAQLICNLLYSEVMQNGSGFIAWRYSVLKEPRGQMDK